MIDKRSSLIIKHDDNGVFTNHTHRMATFGRDNVTLTILSAEDYIWVGFHKPINAIYIDVVTADVTESILECSYWNGSAYVDTTTLTDDTLGLFRAGFVKWDRELTDQAKSVLDGEEMFWYRVKPNVDRAGLVLSGINLVFSDDYELSLEQPYISDSEFLGTEVSHIKTHSAVKAAIIQKFRNKNYIKYNNITGDREDITCWDLLDIEEVKLAATYLALSKIYFQLSDNADDVWSSKATYYEEKFEKFINIARLSLDIDDDGLESTGENKKPFKTRYFNR